MAESYKSNDVSVSTFTNSKGTPKLMVRISEAVAQAVFLERDPDAVDRFLDTVARAANATAES